jgi:hypothetical protein
MKKKILWIVLIILVVIQFFRPEKTSDSATTEHDITTKYAVPENVAHILDVACNDCHSNTTRYPWYYNIQPITWWLNDHIQEGRRELNFSEFTKRRISSQNHKFEETIELVREKEMPLPSYTWLGLHSEAKLTDEQRDILIHWAEAQMDSLKAQYPADSLVMKKRGAPQPG